MKQNKILCQLPWLILAVLGACCLGVVALRRGEPISALWIVFAAVSIYLVAYRYYSLYIANNVMKLDPTRSTPAVIRNDGLDYIPTNRHILFGHHFAAIAGAGPLVGPVLAAQMGYLPGTLWLIAGVVLAGAVQDFMVLFLSTRRNGASLGEMVKEEMGPIAGTIALFGCFLIMIIILAVLSLIVVNALADSPWGIFTVGSTIPIAIFMGVYMRYIRPGYIGEISVIGLILLIGSIWLGGVVAGHSYWGPIFTLDHKTITFLLIGYGFVAAMLPVWLLLAPRDYLSTFLKIGTIVGLAIGIMILNPELKMSATTQFTFSDNGPVWSGSLFPFLFITIACGAVSGFHALIASGTTPKLIASEMDIPYIGYAGMLMESFVAIMALVAASIIEPGIYFAMNSAPSVIGADVYTAAATITKWGFAIDPQVLLDTAKDVGETTILHRAGGAPTLAVGIAQILHQLLPGEDSMGFWYHFAILFEALFILTAVDAGTRSGRFMLQDLLGHFVPFLKRTESWTANVIGTGGCVALWGYLLYQGVVDPLGGVKSLWPLFGISNQMLAAVALILCSVVLVKKKQTKYIWITAIPTVWLLLCTTYASLIKIFSDAPMGFYAQAVKYQEALDKGELLAPAKDLKDMGHVIINNYTNTGLSVLFLLVVFSILFFAFKVGIKASKNPVPTDAETPYIPIPEGGVKTSSSH